VDDTVGVEMKWEEEGCRSSHPQVWSVGGACNKLSSRFGRFEKKRERRKAYLKTKKEQLKSTGYCDLIFLCRSPPVEKGEEENTSKVRPFLGIASGGA
jgi:hypothetical protein